jgi:tetratricopeptide (TPR) repeat protein
MYKRPRWAYLVCASLLLWGVGCSADYHVGRGKAALADHDLLGAEEAFRDALAKDPSNGAAMAGLGWTWLLVGEREAARASFSRCGELEEIPVDCLRGLASLAAGDGNIGLARELLEEAKRLAPEDPKVEASIALLLMSSGDLAEACGRYQGLVEKHPKEAEYQLGWAECRFRQGEAEGVVALVEAALQVECPPRTRAMLWQLKARALVAATSGREDPNNCAETGPAVRAWLDAAEQAVGEAKGLGVELPEIHAVSRLIVGRRRVVDEVCPPLGPSAAEVLRGG